jgi:hypothetical protein
MRKLRLCVCKRLHKFLDSDGDWDGVYDESYEYIIYDEEGTEVAGWDGYCSEEAAERAGEMRLNELNKRYESKSKSNGRDWHRKPD